MKLSKIFQYAYLAFAVIFVYDATTKWQADRTAAYMSLGWAALALFMFFFRKRFANKYRNNSK